MKNIYLKFYNIKKYCYFETAKNIKKITWINFKSLPIEISIFLTYIKFSTVIFDENEQKQTIFINRTNRT